MITRRTCQDVRMALARQAVVAPLGLEEPASLLQANED